MVNTGGCGPLVELLAESVGGARVPACMALGFIAGQSDQLAMAVIEAKVPVISTYYCRNTCVKIPLGQYPKIRYRLRLWILS